MSFECNEGICCLDVPDVDSAIRGSCCNPAASRVEVGDGSDVVIPKCLIQDTGLRIPERNVTPILECYYPLSVGREADSVNIFVSFKYMETLECHRVPDAHSLVG